MYVNGEYLTQKTVITNYIDTNVFNVKLGKKPPAGYYTVKVKVYDSNDNLVCETANEAGSISKSFWDDPVVKYAVIVGIFIVIGAAVREYIRSYSQN